MHKPGKLWVQKFWAKLTPSQYGLWESSLRVFSKGGRKKFKIFGKKYKKAQKKYQMIQ